MTNRPGWLCCAALVFLLLPLGVIAQTATTNPEDEYKKLVKVDTEIKPLGENPFGESVNVFDGGLSFHVVDISVPGTGPTIEIGRTFHADGDNAVRWSNSEFGDWDMDYPRLTTLASNQGTIIQGPNQIGWLVNSVARTDRCTNFREPPDQRVGRPGTEPLPADAWWNQGYTLQVPGVADQDMLARSPASPAAPTVGGLNYVALSKDRWHLGCLASTANGEPGEAFMAVGPDGQKYWLNELLYRPARSFGIIRKLGVMAVTRMEDRFGNSLNYNWSGTQLSSIVASDGRAVTFEYADDGVHISKVNVITANSGTRTWTYGYATVPEGGAVLSSVTLPDGSQWTYDLSQLTFDVRSPSPPGHCLDVQAQPDTTQVGAITAPSGLQGRFEAHPVRHARSSVPEACDASTPSSSGPERRPRYTNNLALTSKTITGAGLTTQTWTYQYPLAQASWRATCQTSGCSLTSTSLVVDPSGNTTRYTFYNSADAKEGKPAKTEYFSGDTSGAVVRTETFDYAAFDQGPWPAAYGYGFNVMANLDRQLGETPRSRKVIVQNGDTYTWQALQFDAYARATLTRRFSSLNSAYTVDEGHGWLDSTDLSIVGLPLTETNVTKNEVVSQNNYDANLVLTSRDHFGQRAMNYTFNAQGQLAAFTDPRQNTTTLSNYKLGIPTLITFPDKNAQHPDGTTETVAVDGFGQVVAVTDQAGATTTYSYDSIGRVARIDYPAGDSVSWAPKIYNYAFSADALGIGGSHWVRTITQGSRTDRIDFDAMLNPVLQGKSETGTGALYVSTRTEYDWKGRKTFESYPVDGMVGRGSITAGVTSTYDPIGRVTSSSQPAEFPDHPNVTTATAYLPGGIARVTDPNGNQVSTAYQGFDAPDTEHPVRVDAVDASGQLLATQIIDRNVYAEVRSVTQGGVTRYTFYDPQHRVCRTSEPETGSGMTAYDAAGNAIWTASGQPADTVDRCDYDVVAESDKVNRTYDTMNRLATQVYPAGSVALTFAYDPLGKPASAVSDTGIGTANNKGVVSWTFGRNRLGLLTSEVMAVDSYAWTLGYGYDANGVLASVQYPDGENVAFAPNALGQPTSAGRYLSGATYHPDGQEKSFMLGNGVLFSAERNARTLLSSFSYATAANDAVWESLGYDFNGNIASLTDQASGAQRSRSMAYDGLNRLRSATASALWGTETYTYDAKNDITSIGNGSTSSTYTYNAKNQLASVGGASTHGFLYDARGNVTSRDGQAMVYDIANRLLSVTGKGDFMYDAAGRRVKNTTSSAKTYYAYNSDGILMWEFDPATGQGTDYIHLGKKLVASRKNGAGSADVPFVTAPATAQTGASYTVSWTAVTGATGYELQEQAGSGAWTTIASGMTLSRAVSHTAAGTFHYQVRACGVGGCGAWSAQATTVVGATQVKPAAPTNLTVALSTDQQHITVSWPPVAGATSYVAQTNIATQGALNYSGPATSASMATPVDGTYQFKVQACNAAGCSSVAFSPVLTFRHTPPAPSSITVPQASAGSVNISWAASTYANLYELEQSPDAVAFSKVFSTTDTSTSRIIFVSGAYYFRVRACNSGTCGPYSPVGASTVTIAPSKAPAIAVAPATSTDGCYAVTWGGVTDGAWYVTQEQFNSGTFVTVDNDRSGTLNICGKANGNYGYRVMACNVSGCGPNSVIATVKVLLVPPQPANPVITKTVTTPSNIRFLATWDAVDTATGYEVTKDGATFYTGTSRSVNLQQGGSATLAGAYAVRACNASGCSAFVPFAAP